MDDEERQEREWIREQEAERAAYEQHEFERQQEERRYEMEWIARREQMFETVLMINTLISKIHG